MPHRRPTPQQNRQQGVGRSLLTFGETMGLFVAEQVGNLGSVRRFALGIGGSESNVAMGAARLGAPATWIGRVGRDAVGDLIEQRVRATGVETVAVRDPSFSGIMVRHRPIGGYAVVDYHRAGSAGSHLSPSDIDEDRISSAAILHITGITPALSESAHAAVWHAVEIATAAGVIISMDVNYRAKLWGADKARPVLHDLVSRAGIVFAGPVEAQLVLGASASDTGTLARGIAALGPIEVLLKDGARGCTAVIDEVEHAVPALATVVVDPVGAGDAFVAGYLAERLAGAAPWLRLHTATTLGAYAVSVPGDCDSVPSRSDLAALCDVPVGHEVLR